MNNANDKGKQKVVISLRDLPQSIQPPRDLWAGIQAQIVAKQQEAAGTSRRSMRNPSSLRWMAAAAMIATLAVGMWIGRTMLPAGGPVANGSLTTGTNTPPLTITPRNDATTFQAAYFSDPKYRQTRQALLDSLQAKLASLPPETRQKVMDSLTTIHKSMKDLEDALGKDPSNALLQELLLNTYQDEMRVLTTVHEAGPTGEGI
jgi:hypothetical protein